MFHDGYVTLERLKLPDIILLLDGGGLRWGWTCNCPPHPPPSPAWGEGDTELFSEQ